MADDLFGSPGNPLTELGVSGLERFGGVIQMDPLRELRGKDGMRRFKEMEHNDPIIGGLLFAIDYLIRQVEWKVTPSTTEEDEEAEANRVFIEECFKDLDRSWQDVVSEILSMLVYGWSYHELVFKYRRGAEPREGAQSRYSDGRIGWHRIAGRTQDSLDEWVLDKAGDVLAMNQRAAPDYNLVTIPINKALLFRTTAKYNNPEGRSILRNAYRPWYLKKNIENIQAIGIERDLAGLPVLHVPPEYLSPTATDAQQSMLASFKQLVRNIRRDEQEGVILPRVYDENNNLMFELQLLSTTSRRQFDTKGIIEYYDQRIAMTAMADFLLLGHQQHGSFALSSNKTHLLANALGSLMQVIADQFNTRAIPQLLRMNGMNVEKAPRLIHEDIETSDLGVLGTFVQQIAGAGFQIAEDTDLENYLRDQAGMPPRAPQLPDTEQLMAEREEDRDMSRETARAAQQTARERPQSEE